MATEYVKFKGPCKWAKVYKPDTKYNVYSINVYLDDKGIELLKSKGVQLKLRSDEDGTFVTFRRPVQKIIKGQIVELGAPKVEDSYRNEFDEHIGNGSIVEVTIDVYDTMKGKGHTLRSVAVHDLVEYVKPKE